MSDFDRATFLAEAQSVVLRGLAKGYASGAMATPVPGRPDTKCYEYSGSPWLLLDEYEVDPITHKSIGRVTLLHVSEERPHGRLVWFMAYGGFYKKEAIPCLRAALMANYEKGVFNFGRGSSQHVEGECAYLIGSLNANSFERFSAREAIVRRPDPKGDTLERLGGHNIWGMALV